MYNCLDSIGGYSENVAKSCILADIKEIIDDTFSPDEIKILEIELFGSRINGNYTAQSDLDVKLYYTGMLKEYAVFNLLHEIPMYFSGIKVDVNPIQVFDFP